MVLQPGGRDFAVERDDVTIDIGGGVKEGVEGDVDTEGSGGNDDDGKEGDAAEGLWCWSSLTKTTTPGTRLRQMQREKYPPSVIYIYLLILVIYI